MPAVTPLKNWGGNSYEPHYEEEKSDEYPSSSK